MKNETQKERDLRKSTFIARATSHFDTPEIRKEASDMFEDANPSQENKNGAHKRFANMIEKKCDIADIGCGNANCKDCDTKTLAKESGSSPSWQTREREAFANWLNESSVMPRSEIELKTYLIARISAVRDEIAKEISSLYMNGGFMGGNELTKDDIRVRANNSAITRAAQIARGSTK